MLGYRRCFHDDPSRSSGDFSYGRGLRVSKLHRSEAMSPPWPVLPSWLVLLSRRRDGTLRESRFTHWRPLFPPFRGTSLRLAEVLVDFEPPAGPEAVHDLVADP